MFWKMKHRERSAEIRKYNDEREEVEEIKKDILSRTEHGYHLPQGFESERYNTPLHTAVRELLSEDKIVTSLSYSTTFSTWVVWKPRRDTDGSE